MKFDCLVFCSFWWGKNDSILEMGFVNKVLCFGARQIAMIGVFKMLIVDLFASGRRWIRGHHPAKFASVRATRPGYKECFGGRTGAVITWIFSRDE